MTKKYGLVSGRFQGFHHAHEYMIRQVLADGLIPIVGINDAAPRSPRDPFTFEQRRAMIQQVFPGIPDEHFVRYEFHRTGPGEDLKPVIENSMKPYETIAPLDEFVMYYGAKAVDEKDHFVYGGRHYTTSHSRILVKPIGPVDGKELDMAVVGADDCNATDIRNDFARHRTRMPPGAERYMASQIVSAHINLRALHDDSTDDIPVVDCMPPSDKDWRDEIRKGRRVIVARDCVKS